MALIVEQLVESGDAYGSLLEQILIGPDAMQVDGREDYLEVVLSYIIISKKHPTMLENLPSVFNIYADYDSILQNTALVAAMEETISVLNSSYCNPN